MKKILINIYSLILKIIPENLKDEYISITVNTLKKTDILTYAYNNIGILKWANDEISGEKFVIEKVLKTRLSFENELILFDVGANIGRYSIMLSETLPCSQIYAFEPNIYAFEIFKKNTNKKNIKAYKFGLGTENAVGKIYTYADELHSEHASIFEGHKYVISDKLSRKEIVAIEIEIKTLDSFCNENNIDHIDFLKIDTEGYEYKIICGAINLIKEKKVKIIQFEFNVANILSRTFLKDFYNLLFPQYNFYRVDTERLIPLGEYNSANEIFKFQNILLIDSDLEK